jgi:hypothetical protein
MNPINHQSDVVTMLISFHVNLTKNESEVSITRMCIVGKFTLQASTRVSRSAEPGVPSTAKVIVPLQVNKSRFASPRRPQALAASPVMLR